MPTRSLPAIIFGVLVLAAGCSGDRGNDPTDELTTATAIARSATPDPTSEPTPAIADDDDPGERPDDGSSASPENGTGSAASIGPDAVDLLLSSELTSDQRECAFARLQANPELVERALAAADAGQSVALEDETELVVIAFDCAPETFAAAFTAAVSIDAFELPAAVTRCFVEAMGPDNPDQRPVILGLAALGNDQPVPDTSQAPVVDAMVGCFPGSLFGQLVSAEALADPALAGALDTACVDEGFPPETMRPLWELLVQNPELDFAALDPAATAPLFDAVFSCLSFGRVVASQAAAAGVEISDETVACIDERLTDIDLLTEITTSSDTSATRVAVIECLTPEERATMGG